MPPHRRGRAGALSGDRRPSSVRSSVCLMSRTSALTRKPKGLGRRNFAQGYPRSHATLTPTSRSKCQKSRWGGGILWRRPTRTACFPLFSALKLQLFVVLLPFHCNCAERFSSYCKNCFLQRTFHARNLFLWIILQCVFKKTGRRLIWHNFTNSQHLLFNS